MKIHNLRSFVICCVMMLITAGVLADGEQDLMAVLQSTAGVVQKCDACRKLKMVGTVKAVPVLSGLLGEDRVSHAACNALESIPGQEAAAALREALGKTTGLMQAQIINSIGRRGDQDAVPDLIKLLANADLQVVSAAVIALGGIGGRDAADALKKARAKAPESLQADFVDALLMCADRMRNDGDNKAAAGIYNEISEKSPSDQCRTAAYRGLVLASGDGAGELIVKALTANDCSGHNAVLPLLRDVKGKSVTRKVAALLSKVPAKMQIAIIEGLSQRGDPAAVPQIVEVLKCDSPEVRTAALRALAVLGDTSVAPVLAESASKRTGPEQEVARESLSQLKDQKVCKTLVRCLSDASPAMQSEVVRALGMRRETQAVPALLKMAGEGSEATRLVALKSLAMLGDGAIAGDLVKLLIKAGTDAERGAVEQALSAVCQRSEKPCAFVSRILDAMNGADIPVRVALLRAAGRIGGPDALKALREGNAEKDEMVRDAALRVMADYGGIESAPDLLKLAGEKEPVSRHVLAMRGYWRLVASATACSVEERVKMCEAGIVVAQRPEEKKLGLTELARLMNPAALRLARKLCADESVHNEAETACVRIAVGLLGSHADEARQALKEIAASAKNEDARAEARKAIGAD